MLPMRRIGTPLNQARRARYLVTVGGQEVINARVRDRRRSFDTWPNEHIAHLRVRARAAGIECTITAADIPVPRLCPVLGIELMPGSNSDASPSVDRFDPRLGYVPDNVLVISRRANQLKSNGTSDEFRRVIEYLENGHLLLTRPARVV